MVLFNFLDMSIIPILFYTILLSEPFTLWIFKKKSKTFLINAFENFITLFNINLKHKISLNLHFSYFSTYFLLVDTILQCLLLLMRFLNFSQYYLSQDILNRIEILILELYYGF